MEQLRNQKERLFLALQNVYYRPSSETRAVAEKLLSEMSMVDKFRPSDLNLDKGWIASSCKSCDWTYVYKKDYPYYSFILRCHLDECPKTKGMSAVAPAKS